MKPISRYASLITVIGLLAGGPLAAQTSGTAGSSSSTGTSDSTRTGTSGTRPYNSSATGRQNESPGAAGDMNSPSGSSSTRSANNGYDTSGSTASGGAGATGTSRNSATSGSLRTGSTMSGTAFSGTPDPFLSTIQSGDFASRNQLVNDIEQRLDMQRDALKSLKGEGKRLQGQAKSDFKAALDELESHEKDLKRSLRRARNASADSWNTDRSELASHYDAYVAAFARIQTQLGTAVSSPGTSTDSSSSMSTPSAHGSDMNDATRTRGRSTTGSGVADPSAPSTR